MSSALELGLSTRPRCARAGRNGWQCQEDADDESKYCTKHREQMRARKSIKLAWKQTPAGVAHRLRNDRGYPADEAPVLSARLHDPNETCAICDVPAHVVWALWERGGPFATRHLPNNNRLLTPDRIDVTQPHTLSNTRLACWPCNARRNKEQWPVTKVRLTVRAWWRKYAPKALRWWLQETRIPA